MALYAIGDLHLCLGAPKPMDVFGGAWVGYMEKLRQGFRVIGPEDTTVLMGDELGTGPSQRKGRFFLDPADPGQKNHSKGKSRLLVEHGCEIREILPGKRIHPDVSAE